jgi:hemolysin D
MEPVSRKLALVPKQQLRRAEFELAFLPAALEITETPPSPVGRAIGAIIIAVFCVGLVWASMGSVDIVATSLGKVVPTGGTKLIQPFETGVVRAIHIRDGLRVKAGDVMIELDPTMTDAQSEHQRSDLAASQLEIARLRAALKNRTDPVSEFRPPEGASPELTEMHRQFLISQNAEQNAKLAEIDRQRSEKEAERATVSASIGKLQVTIPAMQQRVDLRKYLVDKGLGSKLTYLTEYQDLIGLQQDLVVQESRLREADAAIATLKETREKTESEYRRILFDALAKAEQKAAGFAQDVIRAERLTKLQVLKAPVDGVVQQLGVHTVGGVVTPAQVLAVVVPADSHLEIEAVLSNRDIGFIQVGQEVEIKVDTFNFTQYGLLHGKVLSVSQDAVARDKPQDRPNDRVSEADTGSSEPRGQELVYKARISLDKAEMQVGDRLVALGPGMAVTAEIKTGSRKIISYLLSPLIKYQQEALRDR